MSLAIYRRPRIPSLAPLSLFAVTACAHYLSSSLEPHPMSSSPDTLPALKQTTAHPVCSTEEEERTRSRQHHYRPGQAYIAGRGMYTLRVRGCVCMCVHC